MRRRILVPWASGNASLGYVTDGLVFQLAGMNNEGNGVFNPNAKSWIDLISGMEFPLASGTGWNSLGGLTNTVNNPGIMSTSDMGADFAAAFAGDRTFELVFTAASQPWGNSNTIVSFGGVSHLTCSRSQRVVTMGCTSLDSVIPAFGQSSGWRGTMSFSGTGQFRRTVGITADYNANSVEYPSRIECSPNGLTSLAPAGGVALFPSIGLYAELYAVRVYSRMLTMDEVAQNLAVDREMYKFDWVE